MENYLSSNVLSTLASAKEKAKMNAELLVRIFVLLTVPFNTFRALQVVHAKIDAQANAPAISANTNLNAPIRPELGNVSAVSAPLPTNALPILIFQGPGTMLVPILLYHRIDESSTESQYYVSPDEFEEQMKLLHDWGYTTITTELLVQAISEGAALP